MQVDLAEAETELSQLVDAAERGEEVVIARNGVPVAQIVPIAKRKAANRKLNFGFLEGKIKPALDSLLFAMTDDEVDHFIWETKRRSDSLAAPSQRGASRGTGQRKPGTDSYVHAARLKVRGRVLLGT